jgi:methylenetetrahydrofolate reductase (NADPH)
MLGAVLQGLGYRGIHIGGIHRDFSSVGAILDRMARIQSAWRDFVPLFDPPRPDGFYAFPERSRSSPPAPAFGRSESPLTVTDRILFPLMRASHNLFFNADAPAAPLIRGVCRLLDRNIGGRVFTHLVEHPAKRLLLGCLQCGDCAIQHVGFLCPESGCPKHTRNGACGGSRSGMCEVYPQRKCVWFRAHCRLARYGDIADMCKGCVPPRMWELNNTSSWINFHLQRDHQSNGGDIAGFCRQATCRLLMDASEE